MRVTCTFRLHGMEEAKGSIPFSSTPKPLLSGGFFASGDRPTRAGGGLLGVYLTRIRRTATTKENT